MTRVLRTAIAPNFEETAASARLRLVRSVELKRPLPVLCSSWLALVSVACATAPVTTRPGEGSLQSQLEVENRSLHVQRVSVDGWELGEVAAGTRARLGPVEPGRRRVTAFVTGRVATLDREEAFLGGQVTRVSIVPAEAPLASPAPFGTLELENASRQDLLVELDDRAPMRLLPGDRRRLTDVQVGERALRLRVPETRYRRHLTVPVLEGDAVVRAVLRVETGSLRIVNPTTEVVLVRIDDAQPTPVAPGAEVTLSEVLATVHTLTAHGERTGIEHRRTVQLTADTTLSWDLSASGGRLSIVNKTGEGLAVSWPGGGAELAAGKSLSVERLGPGPVAVEARGVKTGHIFASVVSLGPGRETVWTPRAGEGTLVVRNGLPEDVELRHGERVLGRVAPDQVATFDGLPEGPVTLSTRGLSSYTERRHRVVISCARSAHLRVRAPVARLLVENSLNETLRVYLDAKPIGTVEPQGRTVFTHVPRGAHLLEAAPARGAPIRTTLTLTTSSRWSVAVSTGALVIENRSGEPLLLPPAWRTTDDALADGASITVRLPPGPRIAHTTGKASGLRYTRRVLLRPEPADGVTWVVHPQRGAVHVFNRTGERQHVHIDGDLIATLRPRSSRVLAVTPGARRLMAVGKRTNDVTESTVLARAAVAATWEIRARLGVVRVENRTNETLDLTLSLEHPTAEARGEALGVAAPGQIKSFGPWPTGRRWLTAQGRWSRVLYRTAVEVSPGVVARWSIEPARGVVVVENRRDEAVRVLVDHVEVGEVGARPEDGPAPRAQFVVPIGGRWVELVGRRTFESMRRQVRVRHDRAVDCVADAGPAAILVDNRTPSPVTIRVGDRVAGIALPHQRERIALLERGEIVVRAISGDDSRMAWQRRFVVDGDRLLNWTITAP